MSTPSDGRPSKRPRPVTTGAIIAIVCSSLLMLQLADMLSTLHTTAMRDRVLEVLGQHQLDLTVAQFLDVIRWYALVTGALAAMALVFASFVLKRHRGARVGLTVTAGLLLLAVPLIGFAPVFLCIAVVLVWSRSGRDWYSGRTTPQAFQQPASLPLMSEQGPPPSPYPFGTPPGEVSPAWPPPEPAQQPPDQPSAGSPAPSVPPAPSPYVSYPAYPGYGYPAYAAPPVRDPNRRPWTVTTAAVLTWIGAGATTLLMLMFVLVLAAGADSFVDEFDTAARDSDITWTREQILALGWGVAAVLLFWSVVSIVLAVLVVRRSNGARIALAISAGMTVVVSLISILSIISAITLLLGIAALVLLFTGGANEWYRGRGGGAVPFTAYQPPFGPPPGSPTGGEPSYWPPPVAPPSTPAADDPSGAPVAPPVPPPPPERPKPW